MVVKFADPRSQFLSHKEEIEQAVKRVLNSDRYILGNEAKDFETEFSRFLDQDEGILTYGVNSGTDALFLALKALGVSHGDEVIAPSHTATPTISAILMAGATPVLVDVCDSTYCIDPKAVEAHLSDRSKAIIAVHLYGQSADLDSLKVICEQNDLKLIEDCAQAAGATNSGRRLGTIGDASCFSFFPTKNLGAIGDGGAVCTRSPDVGKNIERLRQYGWDETRVSLLPGVNSRLDEIQAAILRVKLKYLDEDNEKRVKVAEIYDDLLKEANLVLPESRGDSKSAHVFHLYVVRTKKRNELRNFLRSEGVDTAVHYEVACHKMPTFEAYAGQTLERTEKLTSEILSLPMYPELTQLEQVTVCEKLKVGLERISKR